MGMDTPIMATTRDRLSIREFWYMAAKIPRGMARSTATRVVRFGILHLLGICMRMALVDAMYREEKPMVVFDDPFVNLDREKTEAALKFLEEIGKEYQVIYFTCHESRMWAIKDF